MPHRRWLCLSRQMPFAAAIPQFDMTARFVRDLVPPSRDSEFSIALSRELPNFHEDPAVRSPVSLQPRPPDPVPRSILKKTGISAAPPHQFCFFTLTARPIPYVLWSQSPIAGSLLTRISLSPVAIRTLMASTTEWLQGAIPRPCQTKPLRRPCLVYFRSQKPVA